MSNRIRYREIALDIYRTLSGVQAHVRASGLDAKLVELVYLRVSQVNACAFCVHMHAKSLRVAGETDARIDGLIVWREAPFFTPRERVALDWAEAVTRLGPDHISDAALPSDAGGVRRQRSGRAHLGRRHHQRLEPHGHRLPHDADRGRHSRPGRTREGGRAQPVRALLGRPDPSRVPVRSTRRSSIRRCSRSGPLAGLGGVALGGRGFALLGVDAVHVGHLRQKTAVGGLVGA